MRTRSLLLAALSVTIALPTVACSDSPPDGPLGIGGMEALWCAPGTKAGPRGAGGMARSQPPDGAPMAVCAVTRWRLGNQLANPQRRGRPRDTPKQTVDL
jgi:hypothetical protein